MGFSITYDLGVLGYMLVALLVGAVIIVLIWLLQAARDARHQVKEHEHALDEERDIDA